MSDKLIILLLAFYAIILILSLYERNYVRAEYWLGALLIVHATIKLR